MNSAITDLSQATKKYNIIYSDPPWSFKTYSDKGKGRSAEQHYNCMDVQDIKNLPVQNIAADDCIMFMWATYPCLPEALELIKAWGFVYSTVAFTWVKKNKKARGYFWGMGYWTRSNSEICILATKGNVKRISASVHQIVDTPIEGHSKKPDIVRNKIIELVGDLPRIELFAREMIEGWDCFGNQLPATMQRTLPGVTT